MLINQIRPTTLVGIKRRARDLKKLHGVSQSVALDMAAREAEFQNFKHANKSLKERAIPTHPSSTYASHIAYLSAYWKDKNAGTKGQEVISLRLKVPLDQLNSSKDSIKAKELYAFRNSGPDHLEYKYVQESQSQARETICKAIRVLQFMDATKLRPSEAWAKVYPEGDYDKEIPGHDHSSVWYDRKSKRYVYVDEPYEPAAKHEEEKRRVWALRHNQSVMQSKWRGMYYPEMCHMFLISSIEKGVPLGPIIEALDNLEPPMTTNLWYGKTIPFLPPFISPGAIAKENARKAKSKQKPATGQLKRFHVD